MLPTSQMLVHILPHLHIYHMTLWLDIKSYSWSLYQSTTVQSTDRFPCSLQSLCAAQLTFRLLSSPIRPTSSLWVMRPASVAACHTQPTRQTRAQTQTPPKTSWTALQPIQHCSICPSPCWACHATVMASGCCSTTFLLGSYPQLILTAHAAHSVLPRRSQLGLQIQTTRISLGRSTSGLCQMMLTIHCSPMQHCRW